MSKQYNTPVFNYEKSDFISDTIMGTVKRLSGDFLWLGLFDGDSPVTKHFGNMFGFDNNTGNDKYNAVADAKYRVYFEGNAGWVSNNRDLGTNPIEKKPFLRGVRSWFSGGHEVYEEVKLGNLVVAQQDNREVNNPYFEWKDKWAASISSLIRKITIRCKDEIKYGISVFDDTLIGRNITELSHFDSFREVYADSGSYDRSYTYYGNNESNGAVMQGYQWVNNPYLILSLKNLEAASNSMFDKGLNPYDYSRELVTKSLLKSPLQMIKGIQLIGTDDYLTVRNGEHVLANTVSEDVSITTTAVGGATVVYKMGTVYSDVHVAFNDDPVSMVVANDTAIEIPQFVKVSVVASYGAYDEAKFRSYITHVDGVAVDETTVIPDADIPLIIAGYSIQKGDALPPDTQIIRRGQPIKFPQFQRLKYSQIEDLSFDRSIDPSDKNFVTTAVTPVTTSADTVHYGIYIHPLITEVNLSTMCNAIRRSGAEFAHEALSTISSATSVDPADIGKNPIEFCGEADTVYEVALFGKGMLGYYTPYQFIIPRVLVGEDHVYSNEVMVSGDKLCVDLEGIMMNRAKTNIDFMERLKATSSDGDTVMMMTEVYTTFIRYLNIKAELNYDNENRKTRVDMSFRHGVIDDRKAVKVLLNKTSGETAGLKVRELNDQYTSLETI